MDITWQMRLGHRMVCDWDGPSVLPFTSRMQQGRKRPPQSRERPTILGSKGPKDRGLGMEVQAWRVTQKLGDPKWFLQQVELLAWSWAYTGTTLRGSIFPVDFE